MSQSQNVTEFNTYVHCTALQSCKNWFESEILHLSEMKLAAPGLATALFLNHPSDRGILGGGVANYAVVKAL